MNTKLITAVVTAALIGAAQAILDDLAPKTK